MNISQSFPSTVSSVSFSFLSSQDVRRISVKQITNAVLLDELNRPTIGGLYDPALGPIDKNDVCTTCRLTYFACPGHFGHVELPSPVYHPLFMNTALNLLRGACMFCHQLKMNRTTLIRYIAKFQLLECGLLEAATALDDLQTQRKKQEGNSMDTDQLAEAEDALQKRIKLFAQIHLAKVASTPSQRDAYKDTLVYQAKKDLTHEFLKIVNTKKCNSCGAFAYTFKKEGPHTKIIEYDLTKKQQMQHDALNRTRPDVLSSRAIGSYYNERNSSGDGSDDSEEEEEPQGRTTMSDDSSSDQESDSGRRAAASAQLPKAANGKAKTSRGRNERIMSVEECRAHLRLLFSNESQIMSLLFGRHGVFAPLTPQGATTASADIFFLEVLPVSPTRFRPPAQMGDSLFEHPHNELLAKILNTSYRIRDINTDLKAATSKTSGIDTITQRKMMGNLLEALIQLQVDVNSFMDSGKNPAPVRQGKLPTPGVKQILEKKEGLFRKNMMGKRVNYAARSVISPDVNIESNEIGVPPVFARKLTYPEPVTPLNFHELRQQVITGPKGYPGATFVEYEDGTKQSLDKLTVEQRTAIANQLLTPQQEEHAGRNGIFTRSVAVNKKVYRHLKDGDMLILNRQPTLHKPSMMAHKARVLLGEKTIRMHYANCNSYNADFDGDEMNIHFPQNQVARSEAMHLANTDNQYLVPTSGKPLRGLIQDHVVAGVWMTCQDAFFTREEYFQLLYGALRPEEDSYTDGRLVTLPPTIWKPKPLWTGKQIISTVLKNITPNTAEGLNLDSKAKVPGHLWGKDSLEDKVVFRHGELLCGVLDKSSFGATDFGLVHSVYELYGAEIAGKLLGILSRLFTKFLQHRAFTCRMDDLALTPVGNSQRAEILRQGANLGTQGAIENFPSLATTPKNEVPGTLRQLLEEVLRDDSKMAGLDVTVKSKLAKLTKSIADAVMPHGLYRKFPHNHMQTMTLSGAKGSAVNAQQISCALGQQELEGRRVPVMVSGKTLPSFKAFETKAIAGGYVASRFLTGVKPQEFYFHCMAGREGLIDTAVKTSRSGYLQRCLIKHLEGIHVHYDNTVRGSDSSVYQFYYGGDALDVTKQTHLYQFEFVARNEISLLNKYRPRDVVNVLDAEEARKYTKKVLKKSSERPDKHTSSKREEYEPVMSKFNPSRNLGSTSEKFAEAVAKYVKSNPHKLLVSKEEDEVLGSLKRRDELIPPSRFRTLMEVKYLRSLVEPGEAVGLLASQGVGEPSTQMTLNTFHFAGHGAANVTLGIPRLREIVMTASQKPKTPSMTINVRPGVSIAEVDKFCKRASRLALSQIVDHVIVKEKLTVEHNVRRTDYIIHLTFFPRAEYENEYDVKPKEILAAFGTKFPLHLRKEILTEMKKLDADLKKQMAELGKGKITKESADDNVNDDNAADADVDMAVTGDRDEEQSEVGDGDADDTKHAIQRKQQATYDSDSNSEEEDSGEMGEYDDEALEAEFQDVDGMDVDEEAANKKSKEIKRSKNLKEQVAQVEALFMESFSKCSAFDFNESECTIELQFGADTPKLLLVGIVERACQKTIIREISDITDCFRVTEEKGDGQVSMQITTNGSNFPGIWGFAEGAGESIIEVDDLYSNDIYAGLKTYGVEMARAVILKEVSSVFKAYQIGVDIRHLELIADYMTFEGGYKPFNRSGIASNPSPLLKASFETTGSFLSDATLHGDFDDLTSPSGSIVVGRPNATGTGVFDVLTAVQTS